MTRDELRTVRAAQQPHRCGTCNRGPAFHEGCSLVECPERKRFRPIPWGQEQHPLYLHTETP